MQKTIDRLDRILADFATISKDANQPEKTVFEISGYPHYENVISNLLSFFFDIDEEHLFERKIIESFGIKIGLNSSAVEWQSSKTPRREVFTDLNKRIDLVIEIGSVVIAIENKVFASLTNDLEHYSNYLARTFPQSKVYKVVLSVFPISEDVLSGGFVNLTYEDWFTTLLPQIALIMQLRSNKYTQYLLDFVTTIQNFTRKPMINNELVDFFKKNKNSINDLLDTRKRLQKELYEKLKRIDRGAEKVDRDKFEKWNWNDDTLIYTILRKDKNLDLRFIWSVEYVEIALIAREKFDISVLFDKYHNQECFEGKISLEYDNSKIVFNRGIAFDVNGKDEIYSSLIESILGILSGNYGLVLK